MKPSINTLNLPLPRFEFNWSSEGPEERTCIYYLVLPIDKNDIRSNTDNEIGYYNEWKCIIGETNVSGGKSIYSNKVQTPFRDFIHMQIDNKSLGGHLPMYAVCKNLATEIPKEKSLYE